MGTHGRRLGTPKRRRALQFRRLAIRPGVPVLQQRMRSRRLTLPNQAPRSRGGPMDRPPGGDYNHHLNINSQVEGKTANDPPRDRGKRAAAYSACNADTAHYLLALAGGNLRRTALLRRPERPLERPLPG